MTTDPWRQFEQVADREKDEVSEARFCRRLRDAHRAFLRRADVSATRTLRIVVHGRGFASELVKRVNNYNLRADSPMALLAFTNLERYASLATTMSSLAVMGDDGSSESDWEVRSARGGDGSGKVDEE